MRKYTVNFCYSTLTKAEPRKIHVACFFCFLLPKINVGSIANMLILLTYSMSVCTSLPSYNSLTFVASLLHYLKWWFHTFFTCLKSLLLPHFSSCEQMALALLSRMIGSIQWEVPLMFLHFIWMYFPGLSSFLPLFAPAQNLQVLKISLTEAHLLLLV